MAPKSMERFKQGVQMLHVADRQMTDHATEKCVAVRGIACTKVIDPNNVLLHRSKIFTGLLQ